MTTAEEIGKCLLCGGDIREREKFYGCSNWKPNNEGCDFVLWKVVAGKKLSTKQIKTLLKGEKTEKIEGFKSKAGKDFSTILQYNQENKRVEFIFEN
jgi:DNA topoisomerase III